MAPFSSSADRLDPQGSDALATARPHIQHSSPLVELKNALGLPFDRPVPMDPKELHRVDELQDELMARKSPEGRPPSHDLRIAEWRWLALAFALVLAVFTGYAVVQSVAVGWVVMFALLLICLFGIGIGPVLYAGLLRGTEEKEARDTAAAVVKHDADLTP
jgi:hypothetical protein